jgi:recombinational DNA repair ATPase RecF
MNINQIELTNFRSFAGAVVELPTRVTFLIGRNHAGKSSVVDALSLALTGHCRGTAADGKGADAPHPRCRRRRRDEGQADRQPRPRASVGRLHRRAAAERPHVDAGHRGDRRHAP